MTELLERAILLRSRYAIAQLKTLPADEQDALATMILEELEDEAMWDATFAKSQNILAELASQAMAEYQAGKTQELDPETL
jgi:hypothetical protein